MFMAAMEQNQHLANGRLGNPCTVKQDDAVKRGERAFSDLDAGCMGLDRNIGLDKRSHSHLCGLNCP